MGLSLLIELIRSEYGNPDLGRRLENRGVQAGER